jgi:drug/metabolite transporter (DMT)-like permease
VRIGGLGRHQGGVVPRAIRSVTPSTFVIAPPTNESALVPPPPGVGPHDVPRRTALAATGALVFVTAVWGSTFVVVKDVIKTVPPLDFLFLRFALAAAVLLVIRPRALRGLDRTTWRHGLVLGLVLAVGYAAQTFGLQTASASVSGFVTGLFVVFTPLIGAVVLKRKVPRAVWLSVVLATVGLALISLHGFSIGRGELLTVVAAFCFALHIVGLGEWSHRTGAYALAVIQICTVSLVSLVLALAKNGQAGITVPHTANAWWAIGVTSLLGTAASFFIQTWSQARIPPVRAAVVLTMEPVFAGVTGVITGESLALRGWAGAALVLAAMYLVELAPGSPQ